jgi:hypothetical protein
MNVHHRDTESTEINRNQKAKIKMQNDNAKFKIFCILVCDFDF